MPFEWTRTSALRRRWSAGDRRRGVEDETEHVVAQALTVRCAETPKNRRRSWVDSGPPAVSSPTKFLRRRGKGVNDRKKRRGREIRRTRIGAEAHRGVASVVGEVDDGRRSPESMAERNGAAVGVGDCGVYGAPLHGGSTRKTSSGVRRNFPCPRLGSRPRGLTRSQGHRESEHGDAVV